MRPKHCFFVHSATAFVALPSTWPVPVTCCSYGIKDSKKAGRNQLFPEASRMVFSRNRAPVVAPPYFVTVDTANCSTNFEFGCSGFTDASISFPIFFYKEAQPNQRNKENCVKKIPLVERERVRNSLIFRCWSKHQTPWCKRLKLE